ncbi:hypothetical protein FGIG_10456 [Fasciola gigantica]|uniref:Uncharacterized protein n=1 Tax=Fasciola gigantica TaxID=46835 RepID=A0A504YKE8_FASGI|nr:hypothetical protein FGIG_10456 [Fasciola gigantica]
MKNMFLSLGANTRDEQLNALTTACDRLEAEVEALTWQLDQNRRSLNQVQNQRDHLQKQLDEALQWHETLLTDQATAAMNEISVSAGPDQPKTVEAKLDNAYDEVAVESGIERTEQNQLLKNTQELELQENQQQQQQQPLQQPSPVSEVPSQSVITIQHQQITQEVDDLRRQLAELRDREREWAKTESRLLDRQQQFEDEREKHLARIEMLMHTHKSSSMSDLDTTADRRTSSALSRQTDPGQWIELRRVKDELIRWRLYACSLVRTFVDNCEEFIRRTNYNEPEFHTIAERRWYDYAVYLLEILITEAPQRLSESDVELIRRNTSGQQNATIFRRSTMDSLVTNGPDLLSAVTLRRKERSSTQERVAKLARKSLFRKSRDK